MFLKTIAALYIGFIAYSASHDFGEDDAKKYLSNYGYMPNSIHSRLTYEGSNSQDDPYSKALATFQEYYSLTVTGQLNDETVSVMKRPRCGLKDIENPGSPRNNDIGYKHIGAKFEKSQITYRISHYSTKLPKPYVDETIRQAFAVWSEVIPLNFIHKRFEPVDIHVGFFRLQHPLPTGYACESFDGSGPTLAHAPPPSPHMYLHFDDDEIWSNSEKYGVNLFLVAVHEIGHNIGLGHTNLTGRIMRSVYDYTPVFKLHSDDIEGAQTRYGAKPGYRHSSYWNVG